MNAPETTALLTRIAEEAVPDTTDLWPAVRRDAAAKRQAGQRYRAWPRWALAGLGAAAVIAVAAAGALPLWMNVETVSAETLLDRAQNSAGTGTSTYHLTMTRTMPGKGNYSITSEVWYGGTDRQRTAQQTLDPTGATVGRAEIVFNGSQVWIATIKDGQTHVIHTTGTEWTRPADDPAPGSSITDVLARYSPGKGCMTAQMQGEASVAGQASYVIAVTPKLGGCGEAVAVGDYKVGQVRQGTPDGGAGSVTNMQVWVDKHTFLPLKTEVRDGTGAVLDRSEVTSVQYGVAIPDSTFQYSPPAGAQISTFTGGSGADVKRALYSGSENPNPKLGR